MKVSGLFPLLACIVIACNQSDKKTEPVIVHEQPDRVAFFPVTDYLKGQLTDIREQGINPKKITTFNKKEDSSWVKMEDLPGEVASFLTPVIDSSSLAGLFAEKKFLDQTINAFTLTYDPVKPLPDSFHLQHWDVYIDPETDKVKRIYLLKRTADHKTLQLTWQSDKWCKIVTIAANPSGQETVEKEVLIKWDY